MRCWNIIVYLKMMIDWINICFPKIMMIKEFELEQIIQIMSELEMRKAAVGCLQPSSHIK